MAPVPSIANVSVANKLLESIGVAYAVELFSESLYSRRDAFWLDVGNGANPAAAFAFRLTNGANDAANFFRGIQLAEIPTVEEINANPLQHFARLVVGTNVDVQDALRIDDSNDVRNGIDESRTNGPQLVQAIANAANSDKNTAAELRSYLSRANEYSKELVEATGAQLEANAGDTIKPFINEFTKFIADAFFSKPRKSGDGKRVSKEEHEYNYLKQVVKTYDYGTPHQVGSNVEASHIAFALGLIGYKIEQGDALEANCFQPGADWLTYFENTPFEEWESIEYPEDPNRLTYGNYVDCYYFRKLLAECKKLVQGTRAANVKRMIRDMGNATTGQFCISQALGWPAGNYAKAASEILLVDRVNLGRLREIVETQEVLQVTTSS